MKSTFLAISVLGAAAISFAGGPELNFTDLDNKPVQFSTAKSAATAVIFISTKCPVSNAYNDRMNAIYKEFSGKGVQLLFVNANDNEALDEMREHAKSARFEFPVYKDPANTLADKLGAQSTPETFVFDRAGQLKYHGYIDDQKNEARVKVDGLRQALNAVLSGAAPNPAETKAFGCTIKRARKTS